jgi:hypothetical protein
MLLNLPAPPKSPRLAPEFGTSKSIESGGARVMPPMPVGRGVSLLQSLIDADANVMLPDEIFHRNVAVVRRTTRIAGAAGQRPILRFFGTAESKGGILVKGADLTIENVELWESTSADGGNGAGIRFEAAAGVPSNIVCKNVAFRYCENGILGPDNAVNQGTVTLTSCEFDRNGRFESGQEHGIYIGKVDSLLVDRCHFHDTYTGHELKSRAVKSTLRDSTFGSTTSRCSYEAEFPDGGDVLIERCTFIQSPVTDNDFVLGFGAEWKPQSNAQVNSLVVRDSVFWNFDESGYILRFDPKVPSPTIKFENCTFINFTNTYDARYEPNAVTRTGTGNRVISLADAYTIYPSGPRLPSPIVFETVARDALNANSEKMVERQWYRVEATALASELSIPMGQTRGNLAAVIDAWGGVSHRGSEHFFFGTGHGDGIINARAVFDVRTHAWHWGTEQSSEAVIATVNPYEATTLNNGQTNVWAYADGLPSAVHGWSNAFTLPSGDIGQFHYGSKIAIYRVAARKWEYFDQVKTPVRYSQFAIVDEVTSTLFAMPTYYELTLYDTDTMKVRRTIELPRAPSHAVSVDREIWYFCGANGDEVVRLNIDTLRASVLQLVYPKLHAGQMFAPGTACVYDRGVGVIRVDILGRAWVVDPDTMSCFPLASINALPMPRNGLWSRFWVSDGKLYAVPSASSPVMIMKL